MTLTPTQPSPLFVLPSGYVKAGAFIVSSDRAAKQAFEAVDTGAVLLRVASLPIATWSYRNDPSVRHIGPVAQDFHAAFGVGNDDRTIATVDADGVALAAIQALNAKVESQREEIARLRQALKAGERPAFRPYCDAGATRRVRARQRQPRETAGISERAQRAPGQSALILPSTRPTIWSAADAKFASCVTTTTVRPLWCARSRRIACTL
jgi:hypothetical protein